MTHKRKDPQPIKDDGHPSYAGTNFPPRLFYPQADLEARRQCPDGLLPDGDVCPRCGKPRAPSGIGGGTWVHWPDDLLPAEEARRQKLQESIDQKRGGGPDAFPPSYNDYWRHRAQDAEARALKAEAAVLKYPEWSGDNAYSFCPLCGNYLYHDHVAGCLRAELEARRD